MRNELPMNSLIQKITYYFFALLILFPFSVAKAESFIYSIKNRESAFFQNEAITVSGTVVDKSNGMALPGVNVSVKGSNTGTITDFDGVFSLDVPENSTLVFSSIGYKTFTLELTTTSKVTVELEPSLENLDEIVVVGYGTQKKVNLTGAVSEIGGDELQNRPVVNATQALQGLAPGLNITQSGAMGGSLDNKPSINIRGTGTIGQGSNDSPLILIDGAQGDLSAINPNDIESISVLKDAAASSIYGSRAPFGVILVTTKKGKAGKTRVNISSSLRRIEPILVPDMMDSYSFANFVNDAGKNAGQTPFFTEERMQRIKDYMAGTLTTSIPQREDSNVWAAAYPQGNANVDWYQAIFMSSVFAQDHGISVSGGKENLTYFLSGNYLDQPGFMRFGGDQFKRYNTSLRLNADLTDWMALTYTTRFIRENFERPSNMTDNTFHDLTRQGWPILPLYDPNGYLFDAPSPALSLRDGGKDKYVKDVLVQQLHFVLHPLQNWSIMGDFTYRTSNQFRHWDLQYTYNHDVDGNPYIADSRSEVHEDAWKEDYFNANMYTDYSKDIGNHHFKILIGMQIEETNNRSFGATRQGITIPDISVIDATSGTDYNGAVVPPSVNGSYGDWALQGYFGRINYNFDERYLIEGNLRYDGSSRFRSNDRWVLSPSISAGWNMAREEFWEPLKKFVGIFKLRGSYGSLSNQNTDNWYPTYIGMPIGTANGSWLLNGSRPNTASAPGLIDPFLTWESIETWDIGIDFALFDNRLSGSFDYFKRKTNDMIGPAREMPAILGTSVPNTNNTDLETYGFDLSISWKHSLKNGLNYNITALLSDSQTRITNYPNDTRSLGNYITGQLDGNIWGYQTIGIAKTEEEMESHLASLPNGGQDALGSNWNAGDIMYVDINDDGKITNGSNTLDNHGDLIKIGNSTPRYSFGLDMSADWKGFDFRAFFQGILKRDYWQGESSFWGIWGSIWDTAGLEQHMDYFRSDPDHPFGQNLDAYYPRPLLGQGGKNQQVQTRYLINAAYVRLKNIQLGYTLPASVIEKIGLSNVRLYFSAENLWTISDVPEMFDPETLDGGVRGNVYPLSKTYAIGLNLSL